jgi:hypothetical protein
MGTAIESTETGPAKKRSSVRRWFAKGGLAMGLAVGIVAVTSTPAFAASSTCTIWWTGPGSCTTGSVAPYPTYHWVDWRVGGGTAGSTSWYMFDDQGRHVASGTVPAGQIWSGTVTGLVNPWYKIHISSSYAGFATIENNP